MDLYGRPLGEVSFTKVRGGDQEEGVESCVLIAPIPCGLSMHWHAYQWVGAGVDRGDEAVRRSLVPDSVASVQSPMRTGDWSARPGPLIAATFEEVWLAVVWLAGAYNRIRAELPLPGVLLEERLEAAFDLLPRGVDVRWGEWLRGGRFVTIGVACCPNRHVPDCCPIRRLAC